jgi:hypothetical protein
VALNTQRVANHSLAAAAAAQVLSEERLGIRLLALEEPEKLPQSIVLFTVLVGMVVHKLAHPLQLQVLQIPEMADMEQGMTIMAVQERLVVAAEKA